MLMSIMQPAFRRKCLAAFGRVLKFLFLYAVLYYFIGFRKMACEAIYGNISSQCPNLNAYKQFAELKFCPQ